MKNFRQLLEELPSKKIVFALGYYQPATISHSIIVAAVNKISSDQGADSGVFVLADENAKQPPLSLDRRLHFFKRIFKRTAVQATDVSLLDLVKTLSEKYKDLILITSTDKVNEYKKILNKSGINKSIEVLPVVDRDPDSDARIKDLVKTGNFEQFRKYIPKILTDFDTRRLMNELREGMNLKPIVESVRFEISDLREKYHSGDIFNLGDAVTDGNQIYEIVGRGPNYISVVNENGDICKKWLDAVTSVKIHEDITPGYSPEEIVFKGFKTKNLHHSADAVKSFQATIDRYNKGQINDPIAILNALKATDAYMKLNDVHLIQKRSPTEDELQKWHTAHDKARDSLNRIGEFMHHFDYWHNHEHEIQDMENKFNVATQGYEFADSFQQKGQLIEMKYSSTDKIKIARVIASALGVEDVEKVSSPDQLVNNGLRKIRNKPMRAEYVAILHKMLQTADEAGINYDKSLVPQKAQVEEAKVSPDTRPTNELARRLSLARSALEGKPEEHQIDDPLNKKNESDVEAMIKPVSAKSSEVGHSMVSPEESPATRKMKIKYVHEETEDLEEDQTTAEYTVKKWIGSDGEMHQRKMRPHKVSFKNSKSQGEPAVKDVGEFKEETEDDDIKKLDSISDSDLDNLADKVDSEDDVLDVYDDEELALVDDDTGEHVDELKEDVLNEVLSRMERIKAKARFARSASNRERRIKIALKTRSSSSTLNRRARKLAIKLLKSKLAKKPLNKLSVGEKERLERIIAKRKTLINRLAMKLVPKVRRIENTRLTHKSYTK